MSGGKDSGGVYKEYELVKERKKFLALEEEYDGVGGR